MCWQQGIFSLLADADLPPPFALQPSAQQPKARQMLSPIFLSASVPNRELDFYIPDPLAIREAILALVAVAVPERLLVFGGHPAISPMVEHAARSLGAVEHVHIYQSLWFEEDIPPEARRFKNLHWTDRGVDRQESLKIMRRTMILSQPFCAAVLIGGMDGVEVECKYFKELRHGALILPVASTRGAAERLWRESEGPDQADIRRALMEEKHYRALFRRLLPRS